MSGSSAPEVRRWWIVAACSCLLLAACGGDAPEKSAGGKSKSAGAAAPKPPNITDNMVAAVAAGKTVTAVGVYFMLGGSPKVGSALPIEVAILPHLDFSSLRARCDSAGGGMTLVSGDNLEPLADLKAEKVIEHNIVVMPQKAGVYMITVNIETVGGDGMVSRIFYIPVIVAPEGASEAPAETAPAATPASPPSKG